MFEDIIEKVKKSIYKEIGSEEWIYLPQILENDDIHISYKTYISAEVDRWIYKEQMNRVASTNFEFDSPELQEEFNKIDTMLRENARFDGNNLETVIDSAVKTRLNILCRPRNALKWFVFRGETYKPFYEILMQLNFIYDFNYLISSFKEWADVNGFNEDPRKLVSEAEFHRIIENIDNEMIYEMTPEGFVDLINPIFEFFYESGDYDGYNMPIEALIIFLDDKGITPIARSMEKLYGDDGIKVITRQDFTDFVHTMLDEIDKSEDFYKADSELDKIEQIEAETEQTQEEIEIHIDKNVDEIVEEKAYPIEGSSDNSAESIGETEQPSHEETSTSQDQSAYHYSQQIEQNEKPSEDMEFFKELERDHEELMASFNNVESKKLIEFEGSLPENAVEEEMNEQNLVSEEEHTVDAEVMIEKDYDPEPVDKFIDKKYEKKFIKKIFNKNKEEYWNFLTEISAITSWREASRKIDLLLANKSLDPNSGIAEDFREKIKKRYIIK